jgi:hypothetical protein
MAGHFGGITVTLSAAHIDAMRVAPENHLDPVAGRLVRDVHFRGLRVLPRQRSAPNRADIGDLFEDEFVGGRGAVLRHLALNPEDPRRWVDRETDARTAPQRVGVGLADTLSDNHLERTTLGTSADGGHNRASAAALTAT